MFPQRRELRSVRGHAKASQSSLGFSSRQTGSLLLGHFCKSLSFPKPFLSLILQKPCQRHAGICPCAFAKLLITKGSEQREQGGFMLDPWCPVEHGAGALLIPSCPCTQISFLFQDSEQGRWKRGGPRGRGPLPPQGWAVPKVGRGIL